MSSKTIYTLWDGQPIPFLKANDLKEYEDIVWGTRCVFNITDPTLTVYKADGENSAKAVVILPGGGYNLVALYHEGHNLAKVLAQAGITAAVLKYRLPNPESSDQPQRVPLADARQALKVLRSMSDRYGFEKHQVGVLGFSAGGHLAAAASLWEAEDESEPPSFSALIYGLTHLSEANQRWLEESLYFRKLTDTEAAQNQLLNFVHEGTPPAFLVHAYDDEICHVEESTGYAQKLFEHQVPVEMHLFPKGGHGFGMGQKEVGTDQWVPLFIRWLKSAASA